MLSIAATWDNKCRHMTTGKRLYVTV